MDKFTKREFLDSIDIDGPRFDQHVENCKRRRALPPLDLEMKFFSKFLHTAKVKEIVFITKRESKGRG